MRIYIALLAATALTACGVDGPTTVGTAAPPAGSGSTGGGTTGGGTASGGPGGGVTTGTPGTSTTADTEFLAISSEKSFNAIGALQSLQVTNGTTLYQGNASTVRSPSGTVDYSPRDGIFTLTLADTKAGVNASVRFQDPAHRSPTPGATATVSVPTLNGFNYLDVLGPSNSPATAPGGASVSDTYTFFYQRPGVSTNYVSLAGFVRDVINTPATGTPATGTDIFERGALVFGDATLQGNVPSTGTGSFTGGFLASMVNNPSGGASYFQWIAGNSTVAVDFTKASVGLTFAGTVQKAFLNGTEILNTSVKAGAAFNAAGTATIDLVRTGGFAGQFATATFTNPDGTALPVNFSSVSAGSSVAGASSIDGAFYGPGAVNVGGNFRIVGGIPNQRVDIQGAFVGAKGP